MEMCVFFKAGLNSQIWCRRTSELMLLGMFVVLWSANERERNSLTKEHTTCHRIVLLWLCLLHRFKINSEITNFQTLRMPQTRERFMSRPLSNRTAQPNTEKRHVPGAIRNCDSSIHTVPTPSTSLRTCTNDQHCYSELQLKNKFGYYNTMCINMKFTDKRSSIRHSANNNADCLQSNAVQNWVHAEKCC
jgi:hypothetical protein